jgi:hypothetical protein
MFRPHSAIIRYYCYYWIFRPELTVGSKRLLNEEVRYLYSSSDISERSNWAGRDLRSYEVIAIWYSETFQIFVLLKTLIIPLHFCLHILFQFKKVFETDFFFQTFLKLLFRCYYFRKILFFRTLKTVFIFSKIFKLYEIFYICKFVKSFDFY